MPCLAEIYFMRSCFYSIVTRGASRPLLCFYASSLPSMSCHCLLPRFCFSASRPSAGVCFLFLLFFFCLCFSASLLFCFSAFCFLHPNPRNSRTTIAIILIVTMTITVPRNQNTIYLSVYLSIYLSIYLSLSIYIYIYSCLRIYVCLSICTHVYTLSQCGCNGRLQHVCVCIYMYACINA